MRVPLPSFSTPVVPVELRTATGVLAPINTQAPAPSWPLARPSPGQAGRGKSRWSKPRLFVIRLGILLALFLGSSVVEQPAVNRLVAGSNPARGAKRNQSLRRNSRTAKRRNSARVTFCEFSLAGGRSLLNRNLLQASRSVIGRISLRSGLVCRKEPEGNPMCLVSGRGLALVVSMVIALSSAVPAQEQPPDTDGPAPASSAGTTLPSRPFRSSTGKERLGEKWKDEQRIDNCKVPLDKRGPKPRPDACPNAPTG